MKISIHKKNENHSIFNPYHPICYDRTPLECPKRGTQNSGRLVFLGGNTEAVGRHIGELTGADLFIIEPVEPYSSDYRTCTEEARAEIDAQRSRPIRAQVENIGQYDLVLVGTPNWWSTMAPPVLEFLRQHDLSGRQIAPFVTHGGGREARTFSDMEKAAPGAEFLPGFVVSGSRAASCQAEVRAWLDALGLE
ncbi:MAG: hypothetical protein LUD68_01160 [Rikenellaceae bacterium]|nr:hypothetical protein [Rikenellaceae bacterium]